MSNKADNEDSKNHFGKNKDSYTSNMISSSATNDNGNLQQQQKQQQQQNNSNKPKKKTCGRAARRRKRKIRDIKQAVQNLLHGEVIDSKIEKDHDDDDNDENGNEDNKDTTSCLPTDRNRSLPGVILRRNELNPICKENYDIDHGDDNIHHGFNPSDKSMLTSQLGFIPGNGISVVARVHNIQNLYPNLYNLLSQPLPSANTTSTAIGDIDNDGIVGVGDGDDLLSQQYKNGEYPMVLQLYPLVTRDIYHGGKSDGRKFKSRKRGNRSQSTSSTSTSEQQKDDDESPPETSQIKTTITTTTSTIEPFPTMYWLTHPHLKALISQLEIEPSYNVKTMEQKIQTNTKYKEQMSKAHASYGQQRWELLTVDDRKEMEERKWMNALGEERGVAGIRKFEHIKCLHAHAAHYLAFCGNVERIRSQHEQQEGKGSSYQEGIQSASNHGFVENIVGKWVLEAVEELILKGGTLASGNIDDDESNLIT